MPDGTISIGPAVALLLLSLVTAFEKSSRKSSNLVLCKLGKHGSWRLGRNSVLLHTGALLGDGNCRNGNVRNDGIAIKSAYCMLMRFPQRTLLHVDSQSARFVDLGELNVGAEAHFVSPLQNLHEAAHGYESRCALR